MPLPPKVSVPPPLTVKPLPPATNELMVAEMPGARMIVGVLPEPSVSVLPVIA